MQSAFDNAIRDCDQAIGLNPRYVNGFVGRGNAYWHKGEYDRAIQDYNQAIALDPTRASTFMARGSANTQKGDYDSAIQDYSQALLLNGAAAWNGRCWARAIKGQFNDALADCNQALRLEPNNPSFLDSLAFTYLKMANFDQAITGYTAAHREAEEGRQCRR
jgi:tetratricopeptide (TPR) repeat protein